MCQSACMNAKTSTPTPKRTKSTKKKKKSRSQGLSPIDNQFFICTIWVWFLEENKWEIQLGGKMRDSFAPLLLAPWLQELIVWKAVASFVLEIQSGMKLGAFILLGQHMKSLYIPTITDVGLTKHSLTLRWSILNFEVHSLSLTILEFLWLAEQ